MSDKQGFDRDAAVTRSMLGWGVVAGPFYVIVGLVLALTRPGFDLSRHSLSLLTLGDQGWLQQGNLILSGLMAATAAIGALRAIVGGRGRAIGVLVLVYGVCLILSAIFRPDPVEGFPPGAAGGAASVSGVLHLAFGGVGFLCLSVSAFLYAAWARSRGERGHALFGVITGVLVLGGFLAGAALAQQPIGVGMLWLAVVAGWAWLVGASLDFYSVVPHPVIARRPQA